MKQVETQEKAQLELSDWLHIVNYDIVERELHWHFRRHEAVKDSNREWYNLDLLMLSDAMGLYGETDESAIRYDHLVK